MNICSVELILIDKGKERSRFVKSSEKVTDALRVDLHMPTARPPSGMRDAQIGCLCPSAEYLLFIPLAFHIVNCMARRKTLPFLLYCQDI